jgi:hypothetical protein
MLIGALVAVDFALASVALGAILAAQSLARVRGRLRAFGSVLDARDD